MFGSGNVMVFTYLIYLLISFVITVWVGHTLSSRGRIFLVENFQGREALADSTNHLLVVGFYLVNMGFVLLALRFGGQVGSLAEAIELLSTKIGLVVVVLGVMHFFNMMMLVKFRNSSFFRSFENQNQTAVSVELG